jgi:tRNA U38,U39,U40 pseudouridine synthase TruA
MLNQIVGSNFYYGIVGGQFAEYIFETKIKNIFAVQGSIPEEKIKLLRKKGVKITEIPPAQIFLNIEAMHSSYQKRFKDIIGPIKLSKGKTAFVCFAGAGSSPTWATIAQLVKGTPVKVINERCKATGWNERMIRNIIKEAVLIRSGFLKTQRRPKIAKNPKKRPICKTNIKRKLH